jgi:hypothetical protein
MTMADPMTDPKLELLTPANSQIIFIDHQPQMAFGVQSIDKQMLKNNVVALAKSARIFDVPTTLTTVESKGFSGYTYPELLDVFPDAPLLERTSMNAWDDRKVRRLRLHHGPRSPPARRRGKQGPGLRPRLSAGDQAIQPTRRRSWI